MPVTIAAPAGPQALLQHLLLHARTDTEALGEALARDAAQIRRSLERLAHRGIVVERAGSYEIAPAYRTAVADYAEGAISLRELASRR